MNWATRKSLKRYDHVEISPLLHTFRKDSSPSSPPQQQQPSPSQSQSSSGNKIDPAVLFIIVIMAAIFFVSGLIHLLVRFIVKRQDFPSSSPSSPQTNSRRYRRGAVSSEALQRQLQQLFHLHDSGLDQSVIDALPVFLYGDLVGPKEPFDCAVCLCEFADDEKLRLLPVCSHAFHINCIDTWLLSNSTCPLCRGSLFVDNHPLFDFYEPIDEDIEAMDREDQKPHDAEECNRNSGHVGSEEKMVLSVRLGKFKNMAAETSETSGDTQSTVVIAVENQGGIGREEGEASGSRRSNGLDERRCYSMGSYQYVEGDSVLRVALNRNWDGRSGRRKGGVLANLDSIGEEGNRLIVGSKGDSFSVSKIWQWSKKKGKLPIVSDRASLEGGLPWIKGDGEGGT